VSSSLFAICANKGEVTGFEARGYPWWVEAGKTTIGGDPLTAAAVSITGRSDGPLTLLDCARAFTRFRSPQVLAAFLVAFLFLRAAAGGLSWMDLAIAALLIAVQPFTEWLIHVGLLHTKPRKVGGTTVDLPTARAHRWHHREPTVLRAVLIPGSLIAGFLVPVLLAMWLLSWPWTLPAAITSPSG
jgi:hypothetical protein